MWPLVGRDRELSAVRDLLAGASAGGVVITGPAGVGRTRLAFESAQVATALGREVEWVRATRSAAAIPLGAFAAFVPHAAPAGVDRLALARHALAGRGLVLCVDDGHALDHGSAALVHRLAAAREAFVVVTVRDEEAVPDALQALWKDELCDRLAVGAFSRADMERLLAAALGAPADGRTAAALWGLTRGNALFLRELVRHGIERGELADAGGVWRWRGAPAAAGTRLTELVEARLAGLGAPERTLLDLVAVGAPVERSVVRGAGGVPVESRVAESGVGGRRPSVESRGVESGMGGRRPSVESPGVESGMRGGSAPGVESGTDGGSARGVESGRGGGGAPVVAAGTGGDGARGEESGTGGDGTLASLEARGLVELRDDGRRRLVDVAHPIHGEVVRAGLPRARREALQQRLARAVAATGARRRADAVRLAQWYLDTGDPAEPSLFLRAADEELAALDWPRAERFARAAGGGFGARLALARALAGADRAHEADALLTALEAEAATDSERAAVATASARNLAWGLARGGDADAVLRRAEQAVVDDGVRDELFGLRVRIASADGRPVDALAAAGPLLRDDGARERARLHAAIAAAEALAVRGRAGESLALVEAWLPAARRHRTALPLAEPTLTSARAFALWLGGSLVEATEAALAAYALELDRASAQHTALAAATVGTMWLARGRVRTALRWFREAAALLRDGDAVRMLPWAVAGVAQAAAQAAEAEVARAAVAELAGLRLGHKGFEVELGLARAWAAAAAGELSRARKLAREAAERAEARGQDGLAVRAHHERCRLGDAAGAAPALARLAGSAALPERAVLATDGVTAGTVPTGTAASGDVAAGDVAAGDVAVGDVAAGDVAAGDVAAGDVAAGDVAAGDVAAGDAAAGDVAVGDVAAGHMPAVEVAAGVRGGGGGPVEGAFAATAAAHAEALVRRDGRALLAVAERLAAQDALLAAAEAAGAAAAAFRAVGREASARSAAANAERLLAACEGARTPALVGAPAAEALTRREREIAVLASGGLSSREIAGRLVVSVRTVDNHLQRIYRKLGIAGRGDLARVLRG